MKKIPSLSSQGPSMPASKNWFSIVSNNLLICTLIGAVITLIPPFIVYRLWDQPDIRYQIGGDYEFDDRTVTGLHIANEGQRDAENIVVVLDFDAEVIDSKVKAPGINIENISSENSRDYSNYSIKRLVGGEHVTIYFALSNEEGCSCGNDSFVKKISFDGGIGKTGHQNWLNYLIWAITIPIYLIVAIFSFYMAKKQNLDYLEKISEIIRKTVKAHRRGLKGRRLREKVDEQVVGTRYDKKVLRHIADQLVTALGKH